MIVTNHPVGSDPIPRPERSRLGADVTTWLNIANVEGDSVTLSVKEVTFDATVNGKKVNPFEKGMKTQLEWEK